MLAYLFPGQGSQKRGMGSDLFDRFSEYTKQADAILGYSIKALCIEDKHNQLSETQFTQPALFVVNALTYLKTVDDTQQKPDFVAGHSLGEYSALFAAAVFDFPTGLSLVKKRGELMSQAEGGGMAAVLGVERYELLQILQESDLSTITIANYNSYQQLVISGPKKDVEQAGKVLEAKKNATCIPLPVSGAFHSPYMLEAQKQFASFLETFQFATPHFPVISNISAQPYHPAETKKYLANQITSPVEWTKTIEYLQSKPMINFKEIGPGNVLTRLVQRIENKQ